MFEEQIAKGVAYLDADLGPSWVEEDIDPRNQDEDERLESSMQHWQESQADQDYWQQHRAPWQDHSLDCGCPACAGGEPPEQPTDEQGTCLCGVEGCKGLDWLLDGEEPF